MNKSIDLRYTYICAHCGNFAEPSFWSIEVFDCGTILTCDKCGKNTVMLLLTPEVYSEITQLRETHRATCPDCGASIPPDGNCWYCENNPRQESVRPESVPCGNCGVFRTVDEQWYVEKCPYCGDDEWSLIEASLEDVP